MAATFLEASLEPPLANAHRDELREHTVPSLVRLAATQLARAIRDSEAAKAAVPRDIPGATARPRPASIALSVGASIEGAHGEISGGSSTVDAVLRGDGRGDGAAEGSGAGAGVGTPIAARSQAASVTADSVADGPAEEPSMSTPDLVKALPTHLATHLLTAFITEQAPLTDEILHACFAGHPDVSVVDVSGWGRCRASLLALQDSADDAHALTHVRADNLQMSTAQVSALLSSMRRLEAISLRHTRSLTDDSLSMLCRNNCRTLRHLDLSWSNTDMPDWGLNTLFKCEHLTTLRLAGLQNITSDLVAPALSTMTGLTTLSLKGCAAIDSLHDVRLPCVTDIDLSGLMHVPARDLQSLLVPRASELVALRLAETAATPAVLQAMVEAAGETLPALEVLDLSWCDDLGGDGVALLAAACPNLRDLQLRCSSVSDAGMARVAAACPNLRQLNLSRCDNIGGLTIRALADHCTRMEELDLSWCASVSDDGLASLMASMPRLRGITLQGCKTLTEALVDIIAAAPCKTSLRLLDLGWVNAVSDVIVERLMRECGEWITVLDYYTTRHGVHTVADEE